MGRGRPPLELDSWGRVQRLIHYGSPAALVYFRDADGKRRRMIRTGRTHAEAERNLNRALKERLTPTYETLTRESTLGELAKQWIVEIKREEKAIATIARYSSTVRSHVEPSAGLRLYECTVPRLQRLVNGVADRSGPGAARMLIVVLNGMFSLAVRLGAIDTSPAAMLRGPRRRRKEVIAPTLEQIHMLRDLLSAHDRRDSSRGVTIRDLGDIGDILIATGARIGEVLALRWNDIDLENRTLTIKATIVRSPGQGAVIQERPKTDSSTRRLKLPSFALDVLTRRRLDAYCELVFPASGGAVRWPENIRTQWALAVRGTELEWMTPTSCRKAVATYLEAAEDIEAASEQLGHSSSRITSRFYVPAKIDRSDFSSRLDALGGGAQVS